MDAVRWRAPGRVNLIGEHTDYNGGLALPFAIQQSCVAELSTSEEPGVGYDAASAQAGSVRLASLDDVSAAEPWARYVLGPAKVLADAGVDVPPFTVRVDSDVPSGAGLSSSAAVICAVLAGLDDLLGLGLTAEEQVRLAVAVENDVVGAPTGGLDQLVSLRARADHALLCDFSAAGTPRAEHVPLDLETHALTLLVVDTGVRHSHADGAYADRRRACERAAARLGVTTLGELSADDLPTALSRLDEEELRRCVQHVVTEDDRVRGVVSLLRSGRVADIGEHLSGSHASLRDDYRVSCAELDLTVAAVESAGALGARMTGGGFGGCAIALLPLDAVDAAVAAVVAAYAEAGLAEPRWFTARPSPGTRREPDGPGPSPRPA